MEEEDETPENELEAEINGTVEDGAPASVPLVKDPGPVVAS